MKSLKTTLQNWLSGLDNSTAKKKLAEDARKWGNRLLGLAFLAVILSDDAFLKVLSKLVGTNLVSALAVSHLWLIVGTLAAGVLVRGLAFMLDLKKKKPKAPSKPRTKKSA